MAFKMKRMWLYIGIFSGTMLEFVVESLWHQVMFPRLYGVTQSIIQNWAQLFFNALGELSFASIVGFFYLHVPEQKRRLQSGLTIGSILGLLIGLYQFFSWFGSSNISADLIVMVVARTVVLGAVCGLAISFSELKFNPNRKKGAT